MKLSPERIKGLAHLVLDKLITEGMLEPVIERKALAASLDQVITEELRVEDRINAEAKGLLRKYEAEIARGQLNEHELFLKIKKQLVKDKGVVL
jgi:hypothetical protein